MLKLCDLLGWLCDEIIGLLISEVSGISLTYFPNGRKFGVKSVATKLRFQEKCIFKDGFRWKFEQQVQKLFA